jgi:serine/threonine-protein kinase
MVARFNQCCTRAELRSLLADRGGAHFDPALESHLQECDACRGELERLAAGPAWWASARNYLSDGDRPETAQEESLQVHLPAASDFSQPEINSDRVAERAQIIAHLPPGLLEPSDDPAKIGRIGVYEVAELIGRGGMGVVLKAFDAALNRFVALKVLAAELAHNASARRRFAREAQAAAAVVHDHVVPIYAVDGMGPIPYLVMAYIPGHSLQERIDETGPLDVRETLRIGMQTAAGLAAAHAQGLVHRDIKPANILLENGVERVRITDFGLARAMDEASQTQSGVLAGTPQYMAPEQAAGEAIDYRTDLFSLGSVLYAMCTGHSPFRAESTVAVLRRICDGSPRPVREVNPDVPEWLAAIIARLLSKRPSDRFSSAEEVARLLAEHLAHLQHPLSARSPRRMRAVGRLSAGTAAIAVVIAAAWIAMNAIDRDELPNVNAPPSSSPPVRKTAPASAPVKAPSAKAGQPAPGEGMMQRETDAFQAELRVLQDELNRLEAEAFLSDRNSPRFDPLRQIQAGLDALEREIRADVPAKTSETRSKSN